VQLKVIVPAVRCSGSSLFNCAVRARQAETLVKVTFQLCVFVKMIDNDNFQAPGKIDLNVISMQARPIALAGEVKSVKQASNQQDS